MRERVRINQEHTTQILSNDGQVSFEKKNTTITIPSEPSFIKLYLDDIVYLSDVPPKHSAVLYELLKRATYAGNENGMQVIVNNYVKEQVVNNLGLSSVGTVSNAITDLVKGKILYRVGRGAYNFNPWLFGKGDWTEIRKLRLVISYDDINGKTFKAACNYGDR